MRKRFFPAVLTLRLALPISDWFAAGSMGFLKGSKVMFLLATHHAAQLRKGGNAATYSCKNIGINRRMNRRTKRRQIIRESATYPKTIHDDFKGPDISGIVQIMAHLDETISQSLWQLLGPQFCIMIKMPLAAHLEGEQLTMNNCNNTEYL